MSPLHLLWDWDSFAHCNIICILLFVCFFNSSECVLFIVLSVLFSVFHFVCFVVVVFFT